MSTAVKRQKKKDLGIYYTPEPVVRFIFDVLNILKTKEDEEQNRWESQKPTPHYPSVIDPAVGEGVFLKLALESGFTKPKYVFGIDIDEAITQKWEEINLLRSFKSRAELDKHFFHQNGLLPLNSGHVLRYKRGGLREFDAVVGNPPYGGIGVDFKGRLTPENQKLLEALEQFEILSNRKSRNHKSAKNNSNQTALFATRIPSETRHHDKTTVIKLSHSTAIEILFIERFIQLTKSGGWIAIIIPDGILANSNLHYVRQFISEKTKVLAIISLPRGTFKQVGTNAKTNILFLQKYSLQASISKTRNPSSRVFLASIKKLDEEYFNEIRKSFKEFHYYGKV